MCVQVLLSRPYLIPIYGLYLIPIYPILITPVVCVQVLKAWHELSTFLQTFVDNNFDEQALKRAVREQTYWDKVLKTPPPMTSMEQVTRNGAAARCRDAAPRHAPYRSQVLPVLVDIVLVVSSRLGSLLTPLSPILCFTPRHLPVPPCAQPSVFFPDRRLEYVKMTFLGCERDLLLLNILAYSLFDFWLNNTATAILLTYLLECVLCYWRQRYGQAMISKKTLVDERFLF